MIDVRVLLRRVAELAPECERGTALFGGGAGLSALDQDISQLFLGRGETLESLTIIPVLLQDFAEHHEGRLALPFGRLSISGLEENIGKAYAREDHDPAGQSSLPLRTWR